MPPAKRALGVITDDAHDVTVGPFNAQAFGSVPARAHNVRSAVNPAKKICRTDGAAMKAVFGTGPSRWNEAEMSSNASLFAKPVSGTASPMSTGTAPRRISERLAKRLAAHRAYTAALTSSTAAKAISETNMIRLDLTSMPVDASGSNVELFGEGALTPCGVVVLPRCQMMSWTFTGQITWTT